MYRESHEFRNRNFSQRNSQAFRDPTCSGTRKNSDIPTSIAIFEDQQPIDKRIGLAQAASAITAPRIILRAFSDAGPERIGLDITSRRGHH